MTRSIRPSLFPIAAALGCLLALSACQQSGKDHRSAADKTADRIIADKQLDALGRNEPFTIETPADTLRRRLMLDQQLDSSHPASLGSDQLQPLEHWPKDDYLQRTRPEEPKTLDNAAGATPIRLTLVDSLQVAARNSRAYQDEKESVFRAALAMDLEADDFRNTFAGLLQSAFSSDLGGDGAVNGVEASADMSVERRLKSGASLSARIVFDVAQLLSQDRDNSLGLLADLSMTVPLLAGSGRHIVTEPLQQAERNVLYALWEFERFKRTLAVSVASSYLSVLQELDQVNNAQANYTRLIASMQRSAALADAGRLSEIQVDQVRQDVLRARNSWISARERYARALDQFKITLGLPTDAKIELDRDELERLAQSGRDALEKAGQNWEDSQFKVVDGKIILEEPTQRGHGKYELPEDLAIRTAFENRLDLRVTQGQVFDAQRGVVVAADALRPGLNLVLAATAGEGRSVGSATSENAQLRFSQGDYAAMLDFDLPWEKTAERNAYRNALIDLERSVRDLQNDEDQIKLQVRDALRSLREARESYAIQAKAVVVARRRVESTNLFLEAGRAEIRDLLEAEDDLINAQDALTAALVSYRVTELELQRDMGVLQVNEKGVWREYEPEQAN